MKISDNDQSHSCYKEFNIKRREIRTPEYIRGRISCLGALIIPVDPPHPLWALYLDHLIGEYVVKIGM